MLGRRGLPVLWVASSLALACSSGAGSGRSPDDGGAHDRQTGADAPVVDRGLDAGVGDGGGVDSGDSGDSSGGAGGAAPLPPSCAAPPGAALRCGQMKDSCCASPGISGGSFYRNYDGITYSDMSHPAIVSTFRLDRYEVTLARFRRFVSAVTAGWSPPPGSGKHAHLNAGAGLNGGTEPGWDPSWTGRLARTIADWTANLNRGADAQWSAAPGPRENRPINYVSWYEAYAFCIWDGGFLPSDAELNYAAAGGEEQRAYAWSSPPRATAIDGTYAVYNASSVEDVGSRSPQGDGKWGHADLAGNLIEWTLDGNGPLPAACDDCAPLVPALSRDVRSGAYYSPAATVLSSSSSSFGPLDRVAGIGVRCARTVSGTGGVDGGAPDSAPEDGATPPDAGMNPTDAGSNPADADTNPATSVRIPRSIGTAADQGIAIAVTTTGDRVVAGGFTGNDTFDPGFATAVTVGSRAGSQDAYLARYNAAGHLLWLRTAGSSATGDVFGAVAAAPADGIFVGGTHGNSATDLFILGAGEPSETRFMLNGLFFGRYRSDGSLMWAKSTGNNHFGTVDRVAGTAEGGMIAAGLFSRTAVFGVGEASQVTFAQQGTVLPDDGYVARFAPDGTLAWARHLVGNRIDATLLADGSTVVVGMFGETATFTGGASSRTLTPDGFDTFIVSFSATGDLQWAKQIAGPAQVQPDGVTMLSSGDLVVTGTIRPTGPTDLLTRGQAVFGAGDPSQTTLEGVSFDLFLARYTPAGALVWAKLAPGATSSRHGVAPLPDGGAVVGAFFAFQPSGLRPAVFGPGEAGSITLTQLPGFPSQSMLGWFRNDGTARTARIVAQGYFVAINDLTALADGSAIATGGFTAATTFGPLDPNPVMLVGPPSTSAGIVPMDMFLGSYAYPP